jgi:hypothetical protein
MLLQFAGFVWYASALSAKVEQNTRDIVRLEAMNQTRLEANNQLNNRVIRIEEQLIGLKEVLQKIDRTLDDYVRSSPPVAE